MDGYMGLSLQKIVETVLSILAMVFFLIEKQDALATFVLLTIMVVVYLLIVILLCLSRRDGMLASSGQMALECTFGVMLLLTCITAMRDSHSTLVLVGIIMDIIVGVLFLLFAMF